MKPIKNPYIIAKRKPTGTSPSNETSHPVKKCKTTTPSNSMGMEPCLPRADDNTTTPALLVSRTITANPDRIIKKEIPVFQEIEAKSSSIKCNTATTNTQEQTHATFSTPTSLGSLRERDDVAFCWINQPLPEENNAMGRVYFQGFNLRGKLYYIGDVLQVTTMYIDQTVYILSVFQATKSFQGNAYNDGNFYEIQKRGMYK